MGAPQGGRGAASPERERALAGLTANALVLPGLGSLLLGRRSGWLQAALALVGFGLTVVGLAGMVAAWIREGTPPLLGTPHVARALEGIGVFAAGWAWAVLTGWMELRHARRASAQPEVQPRIDPPHARA